MAATRPAHITNPARSFQREQPSSIEMMYGKAGIVIKIIR
jgi:hypothetical protein